MTPCLADFVLRPYKADNIPIVLEKHKALYAQEFHYPPELFGKLVADGLKEFVLWKQAKMWIAEYSDATDDQGMKDTPLLAGCIAVVRSDEVSARLRFMLVEPEFRACGLGRALLEMALEYCQTNDYRRATVSTAGECRVAHRLYARYGFKAFKVTHGTTWGAVSDEWWEKPL
jgi:GNAT superfamily N-acetyltransferase